MMIHGDCLQELKKLAPQSVDMVLADLPYGMTACKWDTCIPFEPLWEQLHRVTKPNAAICMFGSEPFSSVMRMSNLKRFKYDWVWNKRHASNYPLAKKQPMKIHEIVSVFGTKSPRYFPIKTLRDKPVRKGANTGATVFNKGLEQPGWAGKLYTDKYPQSICYFPNRTEKKLHPTQKPLALLEYLIKTYTNECETVLDPTMGSGSTGVACKNTNRAFIGIEKEEDYFNIAKNRMESVHAEDHT